MNAVPVLMPASQRRSREIRVGILVIAGVLAVVLLLLLLTEPAMLRGRYTVYTVAPSAGGLRKGDPVRMRGVNIGRVAGFELLPDKVKIHLEIEDGYFVPSDSRTDLGTANLLGESTVEVIPGESPKQLKAKQEIPGASGETAISKFEDLAGEASQTMGRIQHLLDKKTISNIHSSVTELRSGLGEINRAVASGRKGLAALTKQLRYSANNVERITSLPEWEQAAKQLETLTASMNQAAQKLVLSSQSAESVLSRIEKGEGSLGKLTTDESLFLSAREALTSWNQAAQQISKLAADIRKEPKRYLNLSLF